MNRHIKSQSLTELAMLFLVVATALMSMQWYMKRGIQAAVKAQADLLGPQQTPSRSSRKVSIANSESSESESRIETKRVSTGGAQSMGKSSSKVRSGKSDEVTTFDWN